jgi:hypothetical protein
LRPSLSSLLPHHHGLAQGFLLIACFFDFREFMKETDGCEATNVK